MLSAAVKKQMVSDVPLGVLSGGIDSSLIAALAQENSKEKINSFTIGLMKMILTKQLLPKKFQRK